MSRYIYIKATTQTEGDLHLSDGTNWATSKALIKIIRVITSSPDWDLYILQNDNSYATDDANIPKIQIMEAGNGNQNIYLDLPYEDEDDSDEVHLYYLDNDAANTADLYVIGIALGELAKEATLNTHDGALTIHASVLTTHAGVLTTHAGVLTTHAGALTTHAGALTTHAGVLTTHATALGTHATALGTHATALAALATSFTFTDGNVHAVGMAVGVLASDHWPNRGGSS